MKTNQNISVELRKPQSLILDHQSSNSRLELSLENGASIENFYMNGLHVIAALETIPYGESYASALLFPFVNRISDGTYNFQNEKFQLDCNHAAEGHAIHGLVYNKRFEIVDEHISDKESIISLQYNQENGQTGFPFKYNFQVTYKLGHNTLGIEFQVKNTDGQPFPFSIGWHPYFKTSDISKTTLVFLAKEQFTNNCRNIPVQSDGLSGKRYLNFNAPKDDCYGLNDKKVEFCTPEYKMTIINSNGSNYLQIYTPPQTNLVAIEPMTAAPDCFNNKYGLKVLAPHQIFKEKFQLIFEQPTNHKA